MQLRPRVASRASLIPLLLLVVACSPGGGERARPGTDVVDAASDGFGDTPGDPEPPEVPETVEALDLADAREAIDSVDTADAVEAVDAVDATDASDGADSTDASGPELLTRQRFHDLVAAHDAAALGAYLDAYDMPVCDGGECLFVTVLAGAQAVEVRGSFDGWSAGHAMEPLSFADPAGRRPWTVELAITVDPVVQYKLVVDGAWIVDPANRYFRFAEYGPNSAISAPTVGRLTRFDDVASPQLGTTRSLYVYLPAAYFAEPLRRFGVLYLQDGFNVFTNPLATYGSWDVEATADLRMGQGLAEPLVLVGIDTADRFDEYTWCAVHVDLGDGSDFWTTPRLADYTDFLTDTVVPMIDTRFRTIPDREHRGIAGSSLGGVSSFWIGWNHPQVFSRAGVFSPSTWIGEPELGDDSACTSLRAMVAEGPGPTPSELRVYLDSGDTDFEGTSTYASDSWAGTDWTRNALITAGWQNRAAWDTDGDLSTPPADLPATTAPGEVPHLAYSGSPPAPYAGWGDYLGVGADLLSLVGHGHVHNEAAWKQRFDAALMFLFPGPALQP